MPLKVRKITKEFKDFALRGNFLELAIGIAVGTAFNKVVTSFVQDILTPPIGVIIGRVDFSNLFINLSGVDYKNIVDAQKAGAATFNYGLFINTIINFFIISLAVFFIVKQVKRVQQLDFGENSKDALPAQKLCPYCQMKIPYLAVRCPECTSQLNIQKETSI